MFIQCLLGRRTLLLASLGNVKAIQVINSITNDFFMATPPPSTSPSFNSRRQREWQARGKPFSNLCSQSCCQFRPQLSFDHSTNNRDNPDNFSSQIDSGSSHQQRQQIWPNTNEKACAKIVAEFVIYPGHNEQAWENSITGLAIGRHHHR